MRFGVAYYPEQWPRARWAGDVARMADMGFRSARMMEFAWSTIEPEPGRFDFSLFDEVLGLLEARGMTALLGTPTAAPPSWLAAEDPDFAQTYVDGTRRDFGQRRAACLQGAAYRAAARRVVAEVARRYGGDPRVEGFQIDNELGHEGSDLCVCPRCAARFGPWLEARYGSVAALNAAWGASFWSATLRSFAEARPPRAFVGTGQNPGLILDYYRYMSEVLVGLAAEQAAVLRAGMAGDQYLTTNLYATPMAAALDARLLLAPLDLAGYDNYPVWGDQDAPIPHYFNAFMLAHARGLKRGKPFAILEEFAGIQGHGYLGHLPPPGKVALWSAQAIAQGADRVFFFRYRTADRGQEQLCQGIFDNDDAENARSREIRAHLRAAPAAFGRTAPTPVLSDACVAYHRPSCWLLRDQPLSRGLDLRPAPWMRAGADRELARCYAPFSLLHVNCDVVDVEALDPAAYKLIVLPLYQLADPAVADRLSAWVAAGGVLVLGWRTGARTPLNAAVQAPLPGPFAAMAGLEVEAFESLGGGKGRMRMGILRDECLVWADILRCTTARAVARYAGRKHYAGRPCVAVNAWGEGKVWYLGTTPGPLALLLLFRKIMRSAGLGPRFKGPHIESVLRRDDAGRPVRVVLNHGPRPARAFGRRIPARGFRTIEG